MKRIQKLITYFLALLLISCQPANDKNNDWVIIGYLNSIQTTQGESNHWTIGCEVLDRDYANYFSYNNYLQELGAKTARLQLGWAKCEKKKGIYNYSWLEDIIFDLEAKGIRPWLQFSYGNPVYEGGGDPTLGGGMPFSEEALKAWDNWVSKTVMYFAGFTNYWEIWNEPNLPNKNNICHSPEDYGRFFIRTAEIVKQIQPNAFISGLSHCGMHESSFSYIKSFLDYLKNRDKLELLDEITYHPYPEIPEVIYPLADSLRVLVNGYSSSITIKHGETGCPSGYQDGGALGKFYWTETSQSKWLLRRMAGDFGHNIQTSIFTIIDYSYPRTKSLYDKGYTIRMGLLASDSHKKVSKVKSSYFAVQNTIGLLTPKWQPTGSGLCKIELPAARDREGDVCYHHFIQTETRNHMLK
jgi:hypothetical protein